MFIFYPTLISKPEPVLSIRVGAYDNAPKVFQDEDGEWVGFFPDIVNYIAEQENWEINWVAGTWDECLARLEAGELDIMIDVAWSESRAEKYDFNQVSVFENWGVVYTGTSLVVESFWDLENKTVAVMAGNIHYKNEQGIYNITQKFGITCNWVELADQTKVFEYLDAHSDAAGVVNRLFGLLTYDRLSPARLDNFIQLTFLLEYMIYYCSDFDFR